MRSDRLETCIQLAFQNSIGNIIDRNVAYSSNKERRNNHTIESSLDLQ